MHRTILLGNKNLLHSNHIKGKTVGGAIHRQKNYSYKNTLNDEFKKINLTPSSDTHSKTSIKIKNIVKKRPIKLLL